MERDIFSGVINVSVATFLQKENTLYIYQIWKEMSCTFHGLFYTSDGIPEILPFIWFPTTLSPRLWIRWENK